MPARPNKPCNKPGCPALTTERYCEKHKPELYQHDQHRGTAAERGYTSKWTEYSRRFRKEHPLCVMCLGRNQIKPSQHVDHIIPVNGKDDPNFWKLENHQALCHTCHNEKTRTQDKRGFGNRA